MNDLPALVFAWLAGLLFGAIFFGGLWLTVRKGVAAARPAVWFFVSILLRTAIVMTGFYFVGHGDWRRLAACLIGFLNAQILITLISAILALSIKDALHEP